MSDCLFVIIIRVYIMYHQFLHQFVAINKQICMAALRQIHVGKVDETEEIDSCRAFLVGCIEDERNVNYNCSRKN